MGIADPKQHLDLRDILGRAPLLREHTAVGVLKGSMRWPPSWAEPMPRPVRRKSGRRCEKRRSSFRARSARQWRHRLAVELATRARERKAQGGAGRLLRRTPKRWGIGR